MDIWDNVYIQKQNKVASIFNENNVKAHKIITDV